MPMTSAYDLVEAGQGKGRVQGPASEDVEYTKMLKILRSLFLIGALTATWIALALIAGTVMTGR